ncbi:N-acetylglutamate synthase, partial [Terfezia boudieri ATCC MYA-4762]
DFYLSILKSSSTKREARSYLQRFARPNGLPVESTTNTPSSLPSPSPSLFAGLQNHTAPNSLLGDQKARTSAWIKRILSHQQVITPTDFIYAPSSATFTPEIKEEQIHLALVKIRQVQDVSDDTLRGIGKTLVKLGKLGLVPAVVIDPLSMVEGRAAPSSLEWRKEMRMQSERVVEAIEQAKGHARAVDGACAVKQLKRKVSITLPHLIIAALSHGTIPILAPIAFDDDQKAVEVNADSIILALVRLFSTSAEVAPRPNAEPSLLSVDKIIYIDPLGGIPSTDRPNNSAHVFLNMQQEYGAVREELVAGTIGNQGLSETEKEIHLRTLATLRKALAILPANSSAMITTPDAAAVTTRPSRAIAATGSSSIRSSAGMITPQLSLTNKVPLDRNPLIHNLLTDKPVFSSSLPISSPNSPYTTSTTLLKHGIPLLIMTNPAYPYPGHKVLKLNDGSVDLDRLAFLIEDSFGRKLDVERYLKRVNDKIAGLIVAGEYEGAAIVTWETDGRTGGGYGARGLQGWKKVLYLDKFAVLRKSQGTGGVADVVFKAMVMGVFPGEGILWRSRKENVVNKWYFDRAKGTYRIPDSGWTMFWTGGQGGELDGGRGKFEQYLAICRGVEPSFKG